MDAGIREGLASTVFAAVERADLDTALTEDVVLRGDGGGKAPALGHSIVGGADVACTLLTWARIGERFGRSLP